MYLTHGQPYLFFVLISDNTNSSLHSLSWVCLKRVWTAWVIEEQGWRQKQRHVAHSLKFIILSTKITLRKVIKSDKTIWFTSQMSEKLWVFEMTHKYHVSQGVLVSGQDKPCISGTMSLLLCQAWWMTLWGLGLLLESQWPKRTIQRLSAGGPWLRNDESRLGQQYSADFHGHQRSRIYQ